MKTDPFILFRQLRAANVHGSEVSRREAGKIHAMDTFVVDAQQVWESALSAATLLRPLPLEAIRRAVPPHAKLWLEVSPSQFVHRHNLGWFVQRAPASNGGFICTGSAWVRMPNGQAAVFYRFEVELDAEGKVCANVRIHDDVLGDEHEYKLHRSNDIYCVLATMYYMNLPGTTVVQMPVGKESSTRFRHKPRPATVWHRLVLPHPERNVSGGRDVFRSGECRRREHTVRRHERTLRSGRKVWIRDHRRGNPSLGQVLPEYKVS